MHVTDLDTLSQDVIFDLLSNPRRRFVISCLKRIDQPITITDLAAEVAAWEEDVPVESIEREQRKRVYVSLYQTHVPKLADAGTIDYDDDTGTVALAEPGHDISECLVTPDRGSDWIHYYLAVALVGAAAYLLLAFDAPGLAAVPDAAAVALVVLGFAAIAIAQLSSIDRVPGPR